MSVKVENLEKSMAKLTVTVAAKEFEEAVEKAYQRTKSRYNVPGFRKGKATRKMIEKAYGAQVFYDAALNEVLDRHYPEAAAESGLDIVSRPEIEIKELEEGKELSCEVKH